MSKAVLISIRPKWCELIASGQKTVEVRKTRPKMLAPFKVYIYETRGNELFGNETYHSVKKGNGRGMVIGEFVCRNIFPLSFYASEASFFDTVPPMNVPETCLTDKEIVEYLGNGKTGYGWLISDLVIYDEPKGLREFYRWNGWYHEQMERPPQSWCYVEEKTE